jgi:hypothetical protein
MVGKALHTLSVIVRFHNLERAYELHRCIFSLVCQSYPALQILLVTQRFKDSEIQILREYLAPILALNESVQCEIYNYFESLPSDARSALINLGINSATGRYLAFLDHDDTILPSGYPTLIAELERSGATIAFASVAYKEVDVFQDALLVERRLEAFVGSSLLDLFHHNFCPIHSFVIDTTRSARHDLHFDPVLSKHEDYEFLLRLCARYESSFELIGTFVGDYYLKNDGSNTNTGLSGSTPEAEADWKQSSQFLESRKAAIFLSDAVQRCLGLHPFNPHLTIAKLLKNTCHD